MFIHVVVFWYLVIIGVTPTEGSVNGGTLIIIYVDYFNPNTDDVEVFVGGPCM